MARRVLLGLLATASAAFAFAPTLAAAGAPAAPKFDPPVLDEELAGALATARPLEQVRVLVNAGSVAEARTAVTRAGLRALTSFDRIGVVAAVGTPAQVRAVALQRGVVSVEWADQVLGHDLDTSHQATRADQARTAFDAPGGGPYDGSGIGIMIIDGGVDGTHPMFQRGGESKVKRNLEVIPLVDLLMDSPSGAVVDDIDGDNNTDDLGGHGTHVAGIAAGYEVETGTGKVVRGAAPGADLYAVSTATAASSLYGLVAGSYWTLENHEQPCGPNRPDCAPIRTVNNSWGGTEGEAFDENDVFVEIQRAAVAEGLVWVRSSGNSGGDGSSSMVTGGYKIDPMPGIITVANYDDGNTGTRDGITDSTSSRGAAGDPMTWPDIAAPGTGIDSACRIQHSDCLASLSLIDGDPEYAEFTGTSMAAPHIAGYAAVLLDADPTLTPKQVEYVLEDTAYRYADGAPYALIPKDLRDPDGPKSLSSWDKGHGLVDVTAALAAVLGVDDPGQHNACVGYDELVDPTGDAGYLTGLVDGVTVGAGSPMPDVDMVSVRANEVGTAIRFAVEVDDLGEQPSSAGDAVRAFFNAGGVSYTLDMSRDLGAGDAPTSGALSVPDPADPTGVQTIVVADDFPVVFDAETDVAHADLPVSVLQIGAGDALTGVRVLWRRSGGVLAAPADDAEAECPLLVRSDGEAERAAWADRFGARDFHPVVDRWRPQD